MKAIHPEKFLIIITLAIIILIAPFVFYYMAPVDAEGREISLEIQKGEGIREISGKLENSGLIKSSTLFTLYSAVSGKAHRLKAGKYYFDTAMSLPAIARALVRGPIEDIAVIVWEGDTLEQVEERLEDLGIIDTGALSGYPGKSLEGFLLPDTYRFFPNSSADDVVKKFLGNFNQKAMPALAAGCQVPESICRDLSLYELLTIASLIEREVPFQEDRHLVAGVLYKRLSIGMALQVDAAPETYDHNQIPSMPIANPSLSAILAATHPKDGGYLYYLSDPETKKTIFSETFEEHKENKFKYLR